MKYAAFLIRCTFAIPVAFVIGAMAFVLWLQDEFLKASAELNA